MRSRIAPALQALNLVTALQALEIMRSRIAPALQALKLVTALQALEIMRSLVLLGIIISPMVLYMPVKSFISTREQCLQIRL